MPGRIELEIAEDLTLGDLMAHLPARLTAVAEPPIEVHVLHLDTFDWRLYAADLELTLERVLDRQRLCFLGPDDAPVTVPVTRLPRFADDLPVGFIADQVAPLLEMRALVVTGEARVERTLVHLRDPGGDDVAHLWLESGEVLDAESRATGSPLRRLEVVTAPGGEAVAAALAPLGARPAPSRLHLAAAARGREPGGYHSRPRLGLTADEPAPVALRRLLAGLFATVETNAPGVIEDVDSEFLHDLRVAVRRSRSVISELKGVIDRSAFAPWVEELRWLGRRTGELRDLDVQLLDFADLRRALGGGEALDPLEAFVRRLRAEEQRAVASALGGDRFRAFAEAWPRFLGRDEADASQRTIGEEADRRIRKAYRRIVRKGRRLGDDPPAEPLHRLRIDAKKLRYLLELFAELYDAKAVKTLVRDLKKVQSILGGFNDMEVQRERLAGFAERLYAAGEGRSATYLAMGRLDRLLEERQEGYRLGFARAFAAFDSADVRRHVDGLGGRR